jgi:hypothetical protein
MIRLFWFLSKCSFGSVRKEIIPTRIGIVSLKQEFLKLRGPNSGGEFVLSRSWNNDLHDHFTPFFLVLISINHSNVIFVISALFFLFYASLYFWLLWSQDGAIGIMWVTAELTHKLWCQQPVHRVGNPIPSHTACRKAPIATTHVVKLPSWWQATLRAVRW